MENFTVKPPLCIMSDPLSIGYMIGTILAQIVVTVLGLGAMYTLFVPSTRKVQKEALPTRKRQEESFITREELEEELDKHRKALEWEWTEMYEKFEKLHLRLAKREKREQPQQQLPLSGEQREGEHIPSILNYRKQGSI